MLLRVLTAAETLPTSPRVADEMSGLSCLSTMFSRWAGGGLGVVGVHMDALLVVEVGCPAAVEELRMTRPAEEVACNCASERTRGVWPREDDGKDGGGGCSTVPSIVVELTCEELVYLESVAKNFWG